MQIRFGLAAGYERYTVHFWFQNDGLAAAHLVLEGDAGAGKTPEVAGLPEDRQRLVEKAAWGRVNAGPQGGPGIFVPWPLYCGVAAA